MFNTFLFFRILQQITHLMYDCIDFNWRSVETQSCLLKLEPFFIIYLGGLFFNNVDQMLPIIDNLPLVDMLKKFL